MKLKMRYRYLSALVVLLLGAVATAGIEVTDLRCEYLVNPRGIDVVKPRLSWRIVDKGKPAAKDIP